MIGMSEVHETEELGGSELGTKEYWDSAYVNELKNFKDHGDVGEVWFGEDSSLRIRRWLTSCATVRKEDKIIDLGCGNGMMLIELAREGFTDLTGVDYSHHAIDLAKAVAEDHHFNIYYKQCDLLSESGIALDEGKYRIAHDKGTYDAISLSVENPREKRTTYLKNVRRLLSPGGLLLLTSCNWTQDELQTHFQDGFKLAHVIPTPKFKFGGQVGNRVTSLVFEKA